MRSCFDGRWNYSGGDSFLASGDMEYFICRGRVNNGLVFLYGIDPNGT